MLLTQLGKWIVIAGFGLVTLGALLWLAGKAGLLTGFPGPAFRTENFSVYFPVVTCIILSIILTLLLNIILTVQVSRRPAPASIRARRLLP